MESLIVLVIMLGLAGITFILAYNKVEELVRVQHRMQMLLEVLLAPTPQIADVSETHETAEESESISFDAEELTSYEKSRMERDASFEARINELKEQLASQLPDTPRRGTAAQIYDPAVHNLPHNIIPTYDDLPDVEYTE